MALVSEFKVESRFPFGFEAIRRDHLVRQELERLFTCILDIDREHETAAAEAGQDGVKLMLYLDAPTRAGALARGVELIETAVDFCDLRDTAWDVRALEGTDALIVTQSPGALEIGFES